MVRKSKHVRLEHPKLKAATAVICLSGGMDSTSLLLHLLARRKRVFGISFNYGQKHFLELERLAANLEYLKRQGLEVAHTTVNVAQIGELFHSALTSPSWDVPEGFYEQENMKETVVPNRNAIFASIAYGYALSIANRDHEPVAMALGVHSGDHAIYPDCRPEFYQQLLAAFECGNWDADQIELYLPYLHADKKSILQDAAHACEELHLDFDEVFRNTSTSYAPDEQGRASGRTGSDVERILAFHALGRVDPVPYAAPWNEVLQYALAVEAEAKRQA